MNSPARGPLLPSGRRSSWAGRGAADAARGGGASPGPAPSFSAGRNSVSRGAFPGGPQPPEALPLQRPEVGPSAWLYGPESSAGARRGEAGGWGGAPSRVTTCSSLAARPEPPRPSQAWPPTRPLPGRTGPRRGRGGRGGPLVGGGCLCPASAPPKGPRRQPSLTPSLSRGL